MSETLFEYQTRIRDEEVLYLLRAIATKLEVAPFDSEPAPAPAPTPALTVLEEPEAAPTKTRATRFAWSKVDARLRDLESVRTSWKIKKENAASSKYRAECATQETKYKNSANLRRERIKTMIARGTAEVVDGVLYDLRNGRHPWNPDDLSTP